MKSSALLIEVTLGGIMALPRANNSFMAGYHSLPE